MVLPAEAGNWDRAADRIIFVWIIFDCAFFFTAGGSASNVRANQHFGASGKLSCFVFARADESAAGPRAASPANGDRYCERESPHSQIRGSIRARTVDAGSRDGTSAGRPRTESTGKCDERASCFVSTSPEPERSSLAGFSRNFCG